MRRWIMQCVRPAWWRCACGQASGRHRRGNRSYFRPLAEPPRTLSAKRLDAWVPVAPPARAGYNYSTHHLMKGMTCQCPLLVVIGAEDQNPSPADTAELEVRLPKAEQPATVRVFEDAGHAFFADYRPTYREAPAHQLWGEVQDFFRTWLG